MMVVMVEWIGSVEENEPFRYKVCDQRLFVDGVSARSIPIES